MSEAPPLRDTYRHGDLRRVLIAAGYELARTAGPDAITLREATRRAGVVPNAAYRHFTSRDDLVGAVRGVALSALADVIERELATLEPGLGAKARAKARLRAVGRAYIGFAAAERGLFRTAFALTDRPTGPMDGKSSGGGLNPYELLGVALDDMVAADLIESKRRPGAEYLAWSAVHGLAMLVGEGPLSRLGPEMQRDIAKRLVKMVERGL